MFKYGVFFLLSAFSQYFVALFWTQNIMMKKIEFTGSVSGSVIENIPLEFWLIYKMQLFIGIGLILISLLNSKVVKNYYNTYKRNSPYQ